MQFSLHYGFHGVTKVCIPLMSRLLVKSEACVRVVGREWNREYLSSTNVHRGVLSYATRFPVRVCVCRYLERATSYHREIPGGPQRIPWPIIVCFKRAQPSISSLGFAVFGSFAQEYLYKGIEKPDVPTSTDDTGQPPFTNKWHLNYQSPWLVQTLWFP